MIDIGANLCNPQFSHDLNDILENAFHDGVKCCIITGNNIKCSFDAVKIIKENKSQMKLYSTAGIHPHNAKNFNKNSSESILKLIKEQCVVAIGECGLDYNRLFSTKEEQIKCFEEQLRIAETNNLPVFLHERDSGDDFVNILKKYKVSGVVHCFTGKPEHVKEYIKMGFYIGITGWVSDHRRNKTLLESIKYIPLNKLLIETDCPFLTPYNMPFAGKHKRNEPKYLKYIVKTLASLYKVTENEVIKSTTENAKSLFRIDI